ncbi:MAG: hypothetical protein U0805_23140 [Pirellulales bacterium]
MSKTTLKIVRNYDDDCAGDGSSTPTATLDLDADVVLTPVRTYTGPACEKCQTPLKSDVVAICQRCGWYPSLGIYMEVDPDWESDVEDEQAQEPVPQPNHLQVWINLIPRWGWVIIASVLAVVIESILARLVTPSGSSLRMYWSLIQLALGLSVALNCHVLNFLSQAADDSEIGLLDLFLKPIRLWLKTCHWLPRRLVLVDGLACGAVAVLMSLIVIGSLPYERLWDWGFKAPPKQNLMGAVMDRVKELDSQNDNGNLEDSVKDFAGNQDPTGDESKSPPLKPRQSADCVILGYQLSSDGVLSTLVLGTAYRDRLVFAGNVSAKLSEDEAKELLASLQQIKTDRPLVKISTVSAYWVQPRFTCRVTSTEQTKDGRLKDIEWDQLLGAMTATK